MVHNYVEEVQVQGHKRSQTSKAGAQRVQAFREQDSSSHHTLTSAGLWQAGAAVVERPQASHSQGTGWVPGESGYRLEWVRGLRLLEVREQPKPSEDEEDAGRDSSESQP